MYPNGFSFPIFPNSCDRLGRGGKAESLGESASGQRADTGQRRRCRESRQPMHGSGGESKIAALLQPARCSGQPLDELFGRMEKRRDHAQAGRVHRVLRSGDLSGPVSAAGEASSARGGSFLCRGLPRPAAAGTLAEAGVAGGHGAGPGPGVELAVQLCCTGASCGPVRQRGHRFHDSFGVRRPHGLRRQGDSEAGGGSPGQGGLLRRGGPAGPGAGPDGGGTGEISGFRPASGGYHYQLHRSGSVPAGLPAGRRGRLR